jgi:hypothetical protein
MTVANERPIILVGSARSGTTLLRFMLSSHPRIYIPPQSDFIPHLFGRSPQTPLSRPQAMRAVEYIFNARPFSKDWLATRPDPAAFVDSLPDRRPGALLNEIYRQYAAQHGAERWGDKSPTYTAYIGLLSQIFPTAQFIHIIRDGRDVALSTIETFQKDSFHVDMYSAAWTWKRRVQTARAEGMRLGPDHYHELHYEQLVANPEPLLREICDFLGETFSAAMMEPQKQARERLSPTGVHAAVREPLSTHRSGRWRREMPEADQRLFQAVAGDTLADLGYDTLSVGKMSLAETARYAGLRTKCVVLEGGRYALQTVGLFNPH